MVAVQEVLHSMNLKKGSMVITLDLDKAYVRMEWPYIEDMLVDASIPTEMRRTIMNHVTGEQCKLL